MEFIDPDDMADAEKRAVAGGVSVLELMENAGTQVARVVEERYGPLDSKKVLVVAGIGNNGGDGFVAARRLSEKGAAVSVLLAGSPERIRTDEARRNWDALRVPKTSLETAEGVAGFAGFGSCDILVACLLGTGARGEVREPIKTAIEMINASGAARVAIDVPSGLDPLTGSINPVAVKADLTVALHRPKTGTKDRSEYTGEMVVVPIGIPDQPNYK